jgi:hypothetical protein
MLYDMITLSKTVFPEDEYDVSVVAEVSVPTTKSYDVVNVSVVASEPMTVNVEVEL